MAARIVNQYQCYESEIPQRLYRVQYDGVWSLEARVQPSFRSKREFKRDVEDHLDWSNRNSTPFVSTFSSRRHAINWAHQRLDDGFRDVTVLQLDPWRVGPIFSVLNLVQDRTLQVYTDMPQHMYYDEYLVLDRIDESSRMREVFRYFGDGYDSEESDTAELTDYIGAMYVTNH
ncbi:hypothetical protein PHMEG_00031285 [Phytophthora megakarya]|uniref:DUF7587 domain-containing protein n=1 Tax=Phytophthora megakarya TaxID=4795 RepID=A0A225UYF3_9STRA|nr:hypothetical protein PHMEG_00031285 [Phytophthora megakarya]